MRTLFIDGRWREAAAGATRTVRCPADGTVVGTVAEGGPEDTVAAIGAARTAFDAGDWSTAPGAERGAVLDRVADLLAADAAALARAESSDTGKRLVESEYDVADIIACFRYYAALAAADPDRTVDAGDPGVSSRVEYGPVGVCGLITPWNYPLLQAAWKVAPALAAGNTIVLKPSELTPHTAIGLMRALAEAGVPDGVANLVLGPGPAAGAPLAEHPDVDLVSFTGGLVTGRRIAAVAAGTIKRVTLELGGKNPNVVFADTDPEIAASFAVTAAFVHSGQVCSAGTRLIVARELCPALVDEIVRRAERIRLGGPFDPAAQTGPLISAAHRDKVERHVAAALADGARLRTGGARPADPALTDGFYYLPTVLDAVPAGSTALREESFGPVLTVEPFDTEDEAVRLANDTHYGLAGAVFSADADRAGRVARRLRHGTVWVNDFGPYLPQAEWGGLKQSGVGRELGPSGLAEYREARHFYENLRPAPSTWFSG